MIRGTILTLIFGLVIFFSADAQDWFQTGQDAELMLSGPGFNETGGSLQFHHPNGIASNGSNFLLCDRFNNRVLVWNNLPASWDDEPDLVLGQLNFSTNNPGTGKGEMNWPGNVSVSDNGVVTVADTENDRIMIWNTFPTTSGQEADVILDFVNMSDPGTGTQYAWPWGVWTDGSKLSAVSTLGGTLLFWDTLPTTDDELPDYTINHDDFGTPRNISTDGSTYFFVGDHNAKAGDQDEAGTFFWNSYPASEDQEYDFYRSEWIKGIKLDDNSLVAAGIFNIYVWDSMPTTATEAPDFTLRNEYYSNGDAPDVLYEGGKLFVNNYNGNDVQVYDGVPDSEDEQPEFTLGHEVISWNTLNDINYIQNPVMATNGEVLIVTSDFDRTLWLWNSLDVESGQAPDVKVPLQGGDIDAAPWDNAILGNTIVAGGGNKVLVWNSIPTGGETPDHIFTGSIGSFSFSDLKGVALDDEFLYLADRQGDIALFSEVPSTGNEDPEMVISTGFTSLSLMHSDGIYLAVTAQDGPPTILIYEVAELALGNTDPFIELASGPDGIPLNLPASTITFNQSIAIANTANSSIFLWEDISNAGNMDSVIVLGQTSTEGNDAAIGVSNLFNPASLMYYNNSIWTGEVKFSSRIVKFSFEGGNSTSIDYEPGFPEEYILSQNYPNPFNPSTKIEFSLPSDGLVSLKIYDVIGNEIATLLEGAETAGNYQVTWNAQNMASGIYIYRLKVGNSVFSKKMMLIK